MKPLRPASFLFLTALSLLLSGTFQGCSDSEKPKKFTIGFSQSNDLGVWRTLMLEEMNRELTFHPELKLLYRTAGGDSKKQIAQVKELVEQGIDLLIISSMEAEPLTAVVEDVFRKGIPVVVVDSKISSESYTAFVGADNYEIGKMAGLYAAHLLNGRGKILEVHGLVTSSPAMERHAGFSEAISDYPSLQIVDSVQGRWNVQKVSASVREKAPTLQADLVFAHNDAMARAAAETLKKTKGPTPTRFIGIDGLPGNEGGLQLISDKTLTATILYPTGGQEAIQLAAQILNGQPYQRENYLQTTVVDSTNVRLLSLQLSKALEQQRQIERQQKHLLRQERVYKNQQTLVTVLISTLVLALLLGGLSFYSLRMNKKINRTLKKQNEEILQQKDQLAQMSLAAQTASEAKVNFFTKLSHEFRTPLTLILASLEDLKGSSIATKGVHKLALAYKNGIRLLQMVNQLMDFRRIEVDKMRIRATENDLIETAAEALQSFKELAQKRNIDLRLISNERKLTAWYDLSLIDKVFFNLLSNAFKFTGDGGYIHLYISRSPDGNKALLSFEDNGIGLSQEAQQHAFDMFYQEEYQHDKGSGLGLTLSREFVQMHGGTLTLRSEKGKGATFTVELPLGKDHLKPEDLNNAPTTAAKPNHRLYPAEFEDEQPQNGSGSQPAPEPKAATILLIEDNIELRSFLKEKLEGEFEVLQADNGISALQSAFDYLPDLILCDILLPQQDGLSLTKTLKNDLRTAHIPIILLTAQTDMDKQVEGMKNLADAFLTKPFNVRFLLATVRSMLNNRSRLCEHFTTGMSSKMNAPLAGKGDRKFISEFTSFVEAHLSNEELSVEEVSKALGIPKIQLHRKIKALLNTNVSDYILNTRLTKAKYLLKNEEVSINEIASKVGFSSPSYFSTVFKSKVGLSPKDFKKGT